MMNEQLEQNWKSLYHDMQEENRKIKEDFRFMLDSFLFYQKHSEYLSDYEDTLQRVLYNLQKKVYGSDWSFCKKETDG